MKKLTIALAGITLLSGLVVGGATFNKSGATVEPPIVTEVKHQGEQIDNHEARITNTENNVTDLQNKTSTPPSTKTVVVPSVSTPSVAVSSPTPAPTAPKVTVVSVNQVAVPNSEDTNCTLTYSDGTTYTWLWQTVEYNQGTKITHGNGICTNNLIGNER